MALYPTTTTTATITTTTATSIIIIIIVISNIIIGVDGVAISATDVQWRLVEQLLTSAVDGDEVINIDCAFDTWIYMTT